MFFQSHYQSLRTLLAIGLLLCVSLVQAANERPFYVGSPPQATTLPAAADEIAGKLKTAGFQVLGRYEPYAGAMILGISSEALKKAGSHAIHSGFVAAMHVALTQVAQGIEVSYTNPGYFGPAYQAGTLDSVTAQLTQTLGNAGNFGSEKGIPSGDLGGWHYMFGMPYFKDMVELKEFGSHQQAVDAVAKALANANSDLTSLWKLKVDDHQTLFGVELKRGYWADGKLKSIMDKLNGDAKHPHTAALPWEILVHEKTVLYLPGKYRIALAFPDLGMGTFMQISDVPDQMDASAQKLIDLSQ